MSTRYILATTLMETTVNEAERKSMRECKAAIKDLNDKEERLYAVNMVLYKKQRHQSTYIFSAIYAEGWS